MKYKHSHPINIFEQTSKFLVLLVFPVLRALFYSGWNFSGWLSGAWFDILIIIVIILMGILGWYKYIYNLSDEGLYIQKGIVIVKKRFIPYRKLSMVSVVEPFYLMPFCAVRITADTDGGNSRSSDFKITIKKSEVAEFKSRVQAPFTNPNDIKRVYKPQNLYIAILSLVVSNSLAGAVLVSTFISGMGKVLGQEAESLLVGKLTELAQKLAFGLPPIAAYTALVVLGGWAISFLINLVHHLRFCVTRKGNNLNINGGLITRREYLVTVKRVNLIELRQSVLTKLVGLYTALIHCSGYGKGKDEHSVLMPAGSRRDILQNIRLILPEMAVEKPTVRPKIKFLSRFMIPPLTAIGITLAVWLLSYYLFPLLRDVVFFIFIMALITSMWYLAVKIIAFLHTGVAQSDEAYTFCYTYAFSIKTVSVAKRRIIKLTVRRSFFQVMSGCCDLVVLTYSEGTKRHVIPNLPYDEATRIMKLSD